MGIPELIVISEALREKMEGVDIRDILVLMDLPEKPEMLALRGQEEDKVYQDCRVCVENLVKGVTKESLDIQAHRDQKEGKDRQELLDKKAYGVRRGILGLQGHKVQKEKLDQEEGRGIMVLQEKEAHGVSKDQEGDLVILVPMDMDIQEEKEQRVNLGFLAILAQKEKMVTQAIEERRGQRELEGRGVILAFLDLLELQVTKAL